jgi:hypothetical protein
MWFLKRTEIIWTGGDKNKELLHRIKREINTLRVIKSREANWSGHVLRRNCLQNTLLKGR